MGETLAEGGAAGAVVDAINVDAGGTDTVTPAVETPAAPAFDFGAIANDPRFTEAVGSQAAELAEQIVGQRLAGLEEMIRSSFVDDSGGTVDPAALNPWEDGFGSSLDQRFEALEKRVLGAVEQIAQPIMQREMAQVSAEGEQRLQDMVADDIARNGDFPRLPDPQTGELAPASKAQEAVIPIARMLFPEIEQRFGRTPRAAEIAISRASQMVRDIISEASAHALHTEKNRLTDLANTRGEPGGSGTGGVRTLPEANSFSEVTRRHAESIRAARG